MSSETPGQAVGAPRRRSSSLARAWQFVGHYVLPLLYLAAAGWAVSLPGFGWGAAQLAFVLLIACLVMWGLLIIRAALERRWFWRLTITPVVVLLSVVVVQSDRPLTVRWSLSRPAFERAVATGHPTPALIGTYRVTDVRPVPGGGWIFYDAAGNFFDDAGFAYLPHGTAEVPDYGGSFESPKFRHLGGPWYSWTASW